MPSVRTLSFPPTVLCALLVLVVGCSETENSPTEPPEDDTRVLTLAVPNETLLRITAGGGKPSSEDIQNWTAFLHSRSGWPVFEGNQNTMVVTKKNSQQENWLTIDCEPVGECQVQFQDGFTDPQDSPLLWNTQYEVGLAPNFPPGEGEGASACSGLMGVTHVDNDRDGFLDIIAADQEVWCDISGNGCMCQGAVGHGGAPQLPRPSSPLEVSVTPTKDWTFAGEPIEFQASPNGEGVGGTRKYAWFVCKNSGCLPGDDSFDFGSSGNFGTDEFSTSSTFTRTFTSEEIGFYEGVALARDGDDVTGGHYALSDAFDFDVFWNTPLNSEVFGHNLPSTITEGTWIATNVTMRNTGSTTWSGSSYTLKKMAGPFIPSSVSIGSGSASTSEEYTFNFNMSTEPFEPLAGSWYDFDWSVAEGGTPFGEMLQWQTFVKEGSGSAFRLDASPLWAWLVPDELHASTAVPGAQEEELQRVRVEDYPLPRERVQADGRYVLRYETSLGETEWEADFSFLVEYDPAAFEVGELERGRRGGTHLIQVAENTPGRLKVEGTRLPGRALSGEGLIFKIPLVLRDGAEAPASLSLVEVVARR